MRKKSNKKLEYLHKKNLYLFPPKTTLFVCGDKLSAWLNDKKLNINDYLVDSNQNKTTKKPRRPAIALPVTGGGSKLFLQYFAISDFLDAHQTLDYLQFEYATARDMALCTFFKSDQLQRDQSLIHEINKGIPHLINIFKRPLIHLKEADVTLPIDIVKRVNHNSIRKLSMCAEDWAGVKGGEISPSRLLTKVYDDDFGIYENVVFRDLIDELCVFFKKRIVYLSDILCAFSRSIPLDAYYKLNHRMYYLAIGKLYVGFFDFNNTEQISLQIDDTSKLYARIKKYKNHEVYTKNAGAKPITGTIKRTNILLMHRDYKHVYNLQSKLFKRTLNSPESGNAELQQKSTKSYSQFCQMLLLFAAGNFSFTPMGAGTVYKEGAANARFKYKDWMLTVKSGYNDYLGIDLITLTVKSGQHSVRYTLIPMAHYIAHGRKKLYEHITTRLSETGKGSDKYVFCEPFDFDGATVYSYHIRRDKGAPYAILPLSITEINSFRRLQKLIFECMIAVNMDTCAFCGAAFDAALDKSHAENHAENEDNRICLKCRTAVRRTQCMHCGGAVTATYFDDGRKRKSSAGKSDNNLESNTGDSFGNNTGSNQDGYLKDLPHFFGQEKLHYFRNNQEMTQNGCMCPHCGGEIPFK